MTRRKNKKGEVVYNPFEEVFTIEEAVTYLKDTFNIPYSASALRGILNRQEYKPELKSYVRKFGNTWAVHREFLFHEFVLDDE